MKKSGFSLIEVLVVITIIGVIGLVSSTILTRSFRAGTESELIGKLKQNGDQSINLISETIRNSESIVCYEPDPSNSARNIGIVIRSLSGQYTKFKFIDPNLPTANGYIAKQENLSSADYSNFCTSLLVSPAIVAITNKDTASGVSISDGQFQKIAGSLGRDTVAIQYNVNKTLQTPQPSGTVQSETVLLKTTTQVRGDLR